VQKHLSAQCKRPFAAAQGDSEGKHLRDARARQHGEQVGVPGPNELRPYMMFDRLPDYPFFVVTWTPNLIISNTLKRISGRDSDEKLALNIGSSPK
jgi:hypothetical protein